MPNPLLRRIPKIDALAARPDIRALTQAHGYPLVLEALRRATQAVRDLARNGDAAELDQQDLAARICRDTAGLLFQMSQPGLRPAINATGIVLHTGLGRAVLSAAAARSVAAVAAGHSLLEVDAETGGRGSRDVHVVGLLRELTGAGSGLIVNNNAAAVFLAVAVLGGGREVIIARGQLVEIGGSFRIPDVIRHAGGRLVEVGTTNKVRLADYRAALGPETALILRVHPSNFRVVGFTEEPPLEDLVGLGAEAGVPVMDDLGSGALIDLARCGLRGEPTVQESVRAGASVITFSGDKLLGGPQAGLIVGRGEFLEPMRRHPLMRVLRVDKLSLAAMEATLRLYRDEAAAIRAIPTLTAITADPAVLRRRALRLRRLARCPELELRVVPGVSQVGGGSLPGEELPTSLVSAAAAREAGGLARLLRLNRPPVFCRVAQDRVLLDVRTLSDAEVPVVAAAHRRAAAAPAGD